MSQAPADPAALTAKIKDSSLAVSALLSEVRKVIVGQPKMVERLVIGLLADGHVLLEGVPGLAKTLAVRTLARGLDASFSHLAPLAGRLAFVTQSGAIVTSMIDWAHARCIGFSQVLWPEPGTGTMAVPRPTRS